MYSFKNDYSEGAHPSILQALVDTNYVQAPGYGEDPYCEEAAQLLKKEAQTQEGDVHFIAGGTLTNLLVISSFLRPHEAVISADSGHIYTHETGAIEATGHKILTRAPRDGKIYPDQIEDIMEEHYFEHMVKPKLVYISQPTEMGTLYSRSELLDIHHYCQAKGLYLFVDGARLGSALASSHNDVTLKDLAEYSDAFYFGGTKNGALLGEALFLSHPGVREEFRYLIKQRGAMLAKGRIIGLQFLTLFQNNLYLELAEHANKMASKLQEQINQLGYSMQFTSYTNQIFPIFPLPVIEKMEKEFEFFRWEKIDDQNWSIRLVCSWATPKEEIDRFIECLKG
ncbi:threonine aldolase family protein [Spirochaeta cellobiosiphila]|uniref:threonine aldolase family protein n=1 Tax=Spirochaeta cellobiosiphila TaxID=504483 RepID=UPI0004249EAB|nr:low specificity L-threonine aldolase [Spirochaeta cellobiosiphila]